MDLTYDNYLAHYGIKGMKWGVRRKPGPDGTVGSRTKRPEGVSRKVNREAKKDAKESARAKMFYGEGAGNRRKLIKNQVESKSKRDPNYKKAFDLHSQNQNMDKHVSKAKSERKRKDVSKTVGKTTRGIKNLAMGTGASVSVGAVVAYGAYQNPTVRKTVRNAADSTMRTVKNARVRNSARNYLKDNGFV